MRKLSTLYIAIEQANSRLHGRVKDGRNRGTAGTLNTDVAAIQHKIDLLEDELSQRMDWVISRKGPAKDLICLGCESFINYEEIKEHKPVFASVPEYTKSVCPNCQKIGCLQDLS
jgi:hypothetical protein